MIYVGSATSPDYDQELECVLVGPVPLGTSKFVLAVRGFFFYRHRERVGIPPVLERRSGRTILHIPLNLLIPRADART